MSIKYESGTIQTIADTELNSLADATGVVAKEYDNSLTANLYMRALFQLDVTFGTAPNDGDTVDLYLVKPLDGTNYEDGSATVQKESTFIGSFVVRNVTSQQIITLRGIQGEWTEIPPTKIKAIIFNGSGQAFPATGTTVKMLPYRFQ